MRVRDGKVRGIAVHIGARVAQEASAGEVLVSSTVKDLVAGSGLRFRERGVAELEGWGVPGEWRLSRGRGRLTHGVASLGIQVSAKAQVRDPAGNPILLHHRYALSGPR